MRLSFLAVLTGAIPSAFVTRAQAESQDESAEEQMERLEDLSSQLEAIRADLNKAGRKG